MTDTKWTESRQAERRLAFSYAPATARAGIAALFALDDMLASIVRTTREPIVGQMRLTWWYEALIALDDAAPPAEPTLRALHREVVARGVGGRTLAAMTDGWEMLLEPTLDDAALDRFAEARGGGLFAAMAMLLDTADPRVAAAGQGWALADLSYHLTDRAVAERAAAKAMPLLDTALVGRWPVTARCLGALALAARFDVMTPPPGGPRRVGRLMLHRLTGF